MRNRFACKKGTTLIETLIAATLLAAVIAGVLVILTSMLQMWSSGSDQASGNMYGSVAMQKLAIDIQEGHSAQVSEGYLIVNFPVKDAYGNYTDNPNGSTAYYYLSGDSGSIDAAGTNLWKYVGGNRTILAKNVENISFSSSDGRLVHITIKAVGTPEGKEILQSVKLRND